MQHYHRSSNSHFPYELLHVLHAYNRVDENFAMIFVFFFSVAKNRLDQSQNTSWQFSQIMPRIANTSIINLITWAVSYSVEPPRLQSQSLSVAY